MNIYKTLTAETDVQRSAINNLCNRYVDTNNFIPVIESSFQDANALHTYHTIPHNIVIPMNEITTMIVSLERRHVYIRQASSVYQVSISWKEIWRTPNFTGELMLLYSQEEAMSVTNSAVLIESNDTMAFGIMQDGRMLISYKMETILGYNVSLYVSD